MEGDTIKLLAIGGGGLLIGMLFFGGSKKRRGSPDIDATLESMRISSSTNIAFAQAGVENSRIQASLAAEKDRNRTTAQIAAGERQTAVQIAAGEQQTIRHAINRQTALEGFRIRTDKSKFTAQLAQENRMAKRWDLFERFKLGKTLQQEIDLSKINSATAKYAADRNVAIEVGRQELQADAIQNEYITRLVGAGSQIVGSIGDAWNWGAGYVRRGYGGVGAGYDYGAPHYRTVPREGYAGGAGGTGEGVDSTASDLSTIGTTAAAGCIAGPWGCLAGAVVGAGMTLAS